MRSAQSPHTALYFGVLSIALCGGFVCFVGLLLLVSARSIVFAEVLAL